MGSQHGRRPLLKSSTTALHASCPQGFPSAHRPLAAPRQATAPMRSSSQRSCCSRSKKRRGRWSRRRRGGCRSREEDEARRGSRSQGRQRGCRDLKEEEEGKLAARKTGSLTLVGRGNLRERWSAVEFQRWRLGAEFRRPRSVHFLSRGRREEANSSRLIHHERQGSANVRWSADQESLRFYHEQTGSMQKSSSLCTPHSFTIFIASAMVGTWLVVDFDEASMLVLILSTPSSILLQACLYNRKNGLLLSSLSSTLAEEDALRFLLFWFLIFRFALIKLLCISCTSSSVELAEKSLGMVADAPVTWHSQT
jgi:hypothetical protein